MGVFDQIGDALSGKTATPAPTKAKAPSGDWDVERDIKVRAMAAQGMAPDGSPLAPGTSSGADKAMQRHIDKTHPIGPAPKLRGT